MKLFAILITNNATAYGGAQPLRQAVLFVWLGNPIVYKGNTFVWEQGRKLASGSMNGNSFSYTYDGNGMRYKKKVNGTNTYYYYNGAQLLMESKNEDRIYYIYGATGIEGMIYKTRYTETVCYFDKNTLGDIVAIRDSNGNIVATYEYDAWGNCTVMDGYGNVNTSSLFIGNINPIRYRGYYYDVETGFYYLQTRYYDPTICRFINADNYELVATLSSVAGQLNMYAYCGNNPIMYTDPTGEIAGWLIVAAILLFTPVGGTIAQAATSIVSYAGMAVASIWDTDIRADMNAINWNPFNTNGNTVLGSNKVSFYKGVPVFLKNSGRSGSFYAISLNKNDGITGLNHERGHNWQAMMMGIGTYGFTVGIPSPLCLGGWDANGLYYYAPWETMADILGGVKYRYGTKIPQAQVKNAWIYYGISSLCFPFTALYW